LIDQMAVYHPYSYESVYGGVFSNINTNIINGMFFSSGGFSAKYGNVLSGVLDIDTKDEPTELSNAVGLSMACASLSSQIPFAGNTAGLRIETRHSFTKSIFWLNGGSEQFVSFPSSQDINTSLTYRYSSTGRIKLLGIVANDKEEVNVDRPEYQGVFHENSTKHAISMQMKDVFANVLFVKSCLAYTTFDSDWKLGVLDLIRADEGLQWRMDAECQWTPFRRLLFGGETQMRTNEYSGIVPTDDYNIRPDANYKDINSEMHGSRLGTYMELEQSHLLGVERLFASFGCRYDVIPTLDLQWVDPRFRIGYKLGENAAIKVGWGIYHQQPDVRLFNPEDGNPHLLPERAIHTIIGFDQKIADRFDIRLELYNKEYSQLPLKDSLAHYSSNGNGYARGIDFTMRCEIFSGLGGYIGYGYLDTKRHWLDYTDSSPSSYDIPHNLTIVLKYFITPSWQLGATYKYATGRPYTPVIGSQYYSIIDLYAPIYGSTNSARNKEFQRLDMRLTHFTQLFGVAFTTIYLEALNILNIHNIYGCTYSSNYSEQREIYSCFGRRILVLGMVMNF
jgi:vitamin B12 transporter